MARTYRNLPKAKSYGKKYLKNPSNTKQYGMQDALIEETLDEFCSLSKLNRIKKQISNPPDARNDLYLSALAEIWPKV